MGNIYMLYAKTKGKVVGISRLLLVMAHSGKDNIQLARKEKKMHLYQTEPSVSKRLRSKRGAFEFNKDAGYLSVQKDTWCSQKQDRENIKIRIKLSPLL